MEIWRHGDKVMETGSHGHETWKLREMETWRYRYMETWRHALETWIWRHRQRDIDMGTWT
jgi:hypothetical protein